MKMNAKQIPLVVALGLGTLGLVSLTQGSGEEKEPSSDGKKRIVFLVGDDLNHASGTHEFYAGAKLLEKSLKAGELKDHLDIEIVNNWPEDTSVFDDADAIIHYYKGNQTHFVNKNAGLFDGLHKKGVGQMFIHYAVDPDTSVNGSLKSWTGGVYKDKFSTNPHWTLKSTLDKHPINNGVAEYSSHDEWYFNIDFEKEVLLGAEGVVKSDEVYSVMRGNKSDLAKVKKAQKTLKSAQSDSVLTVFWAKESAGGGRGVGVTGAHYHKNWAHDEFRKQVLNGIVWCAKLPVPAGGVESPEITEEEINANLDKRKKGFKKISL
ncbi:ThuA domain-containing protein [Rubritalea spongiae]|uniref:ThuA domain-containing protein n=2 Tax=Rubritalea spongiae TaxID=430797 RepID=A0ABW5DY26_9BACT